MATAREENPYEGGTAGLGTGGKFRKRPFRRAQTTPYDRPPTALRNPNRNNGWLSKLVDPAQRLITSSAHRIFASVFRKRLPPPPSPTPPTQPPSSETEQEVRDNIQEPSIFVANDSSGNRQGTVGGSDVQINCSDGGGLTELEKLLKQKTFTRSEIDHLTALMRSRIVDSLAIEDEKRAEVVPSKPTLPHVQKDECPKTPALENEIESHFVSAPYITSSVPIEDVASPAELARAYMGSRPSKVSPSVFGLRGPAPREDSPFLKSQRFATKSPIMSIVPKATSHGGVHENGFMTPRSLGRSAIYSMARTPYARIYPVSTRKGVGHAVEGEPSSSAQHALDHGILSVSKQEALKRRSSVLDNDIGSVGPIRRVRHKSNLLSSKGLTLPLSGSHLSIARSGVGVDAALQPSSMQKTLSGEVKHGHTKLSTENVEDTVPCTSFPPLPSKSSETASKILQQLDQLVSPKEKSSKLRLSTVNEKSPTKLSSSMLRGQALRSMEMVDSSKFLDDIRDNESDGPRGNLSASPQKFTSQIENTENGPLKLVASSDGFITDAGATVLGKQVISVAKSGDSSTMKSVSCPPQKKRAFHMSAHEDYLDLDDDAYPNGTVSFSTAEKETTGLTDAEEKTTAATETISEEKPPASSTVMPSKGFTIDGETHVGTAEGSMVGQKVNVSTSLTSSIPVPTFKPVTVANTAAAQTLLGSDKSSSPNGSIANPPLFNFGNKVVSPTELTAADAPQKESNKSGSISGLETAADAPQKESKKSDSIFGLEKIVSSKVPGADAPLVNLGTSKNVDNNVPQVPFTFSSSVGDESAGMKFGASSDSMLRSSISSTAAAGAIDSMPKVLESENADGKTNIFSGFSFKSSQPAVSSAASTSLLRSSTNTSTFGHSSNQNNGAVATSTFSSPFPPMDSNNFTSQNMFSSSSLAASSSISAAAASTSTSLTTNAPAVIASSASSSSTTALASSSPATSFFKFGSSPFLSTGLPVSSTGSEPAETKSRQDAGIGNLGSSSFGSSSAAVGSTGSGIFGFSSSAVTTVNGQSHGSLFGTTSGSVLGGPATTATSGFATSTQSQTVAFGSSASSPLFGLNGNTTFSSGSSLFPSSSPATNIFNSGATFGQGTSASSSEANSVSSNSGTSSTFGLSSWQISKPPFGSAFSSSSSSGFPFGISTPSDASNSSPMIFGSSTGASSSPQFSFTSAGATTSMEPAFGNPTPAFTFGSAASVKNDNMSMEDSMAEDTVQATAPVFGQQPASLQSNYVFGASTPTGASPFQFAGQQNIASQNPSLFQASGSLEFNARGGSFSLGTGGGDKSNRKYVKVKHKPRRK